MGSGCRSPFSRAWGKHAANSPQRNRRRRQGKPTKRRESTCRFRATTGDDAQLCAWKRRDHASRAAGVEHGSFALSAEQTAAARRDQRRAGAQIRAAFRERRQRRRWPPTKQDRNARASARGVGHYLETTRRTRDWAPAVAGPASPARGHRTFNIGPIPRTECRLSTWHVNVKKSADDRPQSEACTERKLPSTAERRLEAGPPRAIWRLGGSCTERRG